MLNELSPCRRENVAVVAGVVTLLKYPYSRHMEEISQYDTIKLHIELGPCLSPTDHNQQLSVRTCMLYITTAYSLIDIDVNFSHGVDSTVYHLMVTIFVSTLCLKKGTPTLSIVTLKRINRF